MGKEGECRGSAREQRENKNRQEKAIRPQSLAPLSNATAHAEVLHVSNRIAGALQMLKLNCQSTEGCSSEQCNCSCGGAPSEKQNCCSSAGTQKCSTWIAIAQKDASLSNATANVEGFHVRSTVAGTGSTWVAPAQKDVPLSNATAHSEVVQVRGNVAGAAQWHEMISKSAEKCSFEQCNCSFGGVPSEKQSW